MCLNNTKLHTVLKKGKEKIERGEVGERMIGERGGRGR